MVFHVEDPIPFPRIPMFNAHTPCPVKIVANLFVQSTTGPITIEVQSTPTIVLEIRFYIWEKTCRNLTPFKKKIERSPLPSK